MVEPFAAGVLSTFFPGRAYLKHTSASVVRTIGASNNKPSSSANFLTPARGAKCKTNVVNSNCQVWDSREWACSASRHSICCSSKIHLLLNVLMRRPSFLDTVAMPPLMLEEQGQKFRPSSVHRTSQSSRQRLHSLRRLTSEFRANQRRHISQSSFSKLSVNRFRERLEPSSLPMGTYFCELEKSLGEVEEHLPHLHETELIELLRALADRLDELLYPPYRDRRLIHIHIWGKRLEDLCRLLPSSPSVHSPQQALITRAQAMMGMLSPSIAYVNSIEKWDDHSFHAGGTVTLAVAFYRNLFHSLSLILRELPCLSAHSYIDNVIRILLSRTLDVSTVIPMAVEANWTVAQKENLRSFLFSSNSDDPKRLMHIITEFQANNIAVSRNKILTTSISFVIAKDITNAQKLYDSIPPSNDNKYIRTGINLAAKAGNYKQVQTLFDILKAQGDVEKQEIASLLLSYAEGGHVQEILRVFDEYFPKNDEGKRLNQPDVHHYSIAMHAHARNGDCGAVNTWLEDMQRSGLQPNIYIFSTLIQAYSKTNDLQGILDVFSKMQKLGVKPTAAIYTILLGVFVDRKDLDGAESLYKLACEEGIIPDLGMTRSLMIAFAESGSLERATRVSDYLSSHPRNSGHLLSGHYQLIIKTHVVMGAPFPVVSRLFFELKIIPNIYSYALLVLSACDAGQLNKATKIYYETFRRIKSVSPLSAYIPTMIMSAFLRQGNRVKAKEIYDGMIERGIQPTNDTYREIIRSYRKEGTPESLRVADEFIRRLPEEDRIWDEDDSESKFRVYGPLPSPSTFLSA